MTIPNFWLHDLRRSAATGMQKLGTPPDVIEAVLSHTSADKANSLKDVYIRWMTTPMSRRRRCKRGGKPSSDWPAVALSSQGPSLCPSRRPNTLRHLAENALRHRTRDETVYYHINLCLCITFGCVEWSAQPPIAGDTTSQTQHLGTANPGTPGLTPCPWTVGCPQHDRMTAQHNPAIGRLRAQHSRTPDIVSEGLIAEMPAITVAWSNTPASFSAQGIRQGAFSATAPGAWML
ncbi:hypothetical protein DEV91_12711 [Phyllobacterium brassicacearum]|nr:hypothetical protein DEV91_12711 [Phyllobacterium brassicacearum]